MKVAENIKLAFEAMRKDYKRIYNKNKRKFIQDIDNWVDNTISLRQSGRKLYVCLSVSYDEYMNDLKFQSHLEETWALFNRHFKNLRSVVEDIKFLQNKDQNRYKKIM